MHTVNWDRIRFVLALGIMLHIVLADMPSFSQDLGYNIPLKSSAISASLPNGFTYYIDKNPTPEKKIVLLLGMKVGSILEGDHQLGLAHLLEHMAFRSTRHFKNVFDFFEHNGLERGRDINAKTSYDYTYYWIEIPSGNQQLFMDALMVIKDWCRGMSLKRHEVDSERGVVVGELRYGYDNASRIRRDYSFELLNGSRYYYREPGATKDDILNFRYRSLVDFYDKWYRPSLQSIIVVGDIDQNLAEEMIVEKFSDLANDGISGRPIYDIELRGANQFKIVRDDLSAFSEVYIYMKRNRTSIKTQRDFNEMIISQLYNEMASVRFDRLRDRYLSPFESVSHYNESGEQFIKLEALVTRFSMDIGNTERAFKEVFEEIFRIKRYGFAGEELVRAKHILRNRLTVGSGFTSKDLAMKYLFHFLEGSYVLEEQKFNDLVDKALETISVDSVNSRIDKYISDVNRDIILVVPGNYSGQVPNSSFFDTWIEDVRNSNIAPSKVDSIPTHICGYHLDNPSRSGYRIIRDSSGVTNVVFDSGVKFHIKVVRDKNAYRDIIMHGFSFGGAQKYRGSEYKCAYHSADVAMNSGLCGLDRFQLDRYLSDKSVSLQLYVSDYWHGMLGACNKSGVSDLLKMIKQRFYEVGVDKIAFDDWKSKSITFNEVSANDPKKIFRDSINSFLKSSVDREVPVNNDDFSSIQFEAVNRILVNQYSNIGNFEFVFVGDIDENALIDSIVHYFSPFLVNTEKPLDVGLGAFSARGGIHRIFHENQEKDKANIEFFISGSALIDSNAKVELNLLSSVLQVALTQRLREEGGMTYTVTSSVRYYNNPEGRFVFNIFFDCDPKNVDRVTKYCVDEIRRIREEGIDGQLFDKITVLEKRALERNLMDQNFWMRYLAWQYQDKADASEIQVFDQVLRSFTVEKLISAARKYFQDGNVAQFILLPKA